MDRKVPIDQLDVEQQQRLLQRYSENGDGTFSQSVAVLSIPGVARQIAVGATSTNTILTTTCRKISMYATVDTRFSVGSTAQTAASSSHFIASGERLDFYLPSTPNLAVIRNSSDGVLEVTELL